MNKKIGIFRALDVRFQHAEFAAAFSKFHPIFTANVSPEIKTYLTRNKIAFNDFPLQPKYRFDPVYPILKKTDFTPWLQFETSAIEKNISELDFCEIYEPYFFYSSQIANVAKKKDKPLITEIWTSFPEHPSQYVFPYSRIVKEVINKTNLFVMRSNKALSYLDPFPVSSSKKVVIYHGVNIERFYPSKKIHEKIKILFVGALAAHKGLDDLLAVFSELVKKYPNKLELIICGQGPMKTTVENLAKEAPINFRGLVANSEIAEVYREADIYCQPSKDYYLFGIKGGEEFAGYTFMEALASGLPIVSTNCGGIPEIVGEENKLILQGDRNALYSALDYYISEKSLRFETGLKNRKRAEKIFDIKKQTALLEKEILTRFL